MKNMTLEQIAQACGGTLKRDQKGRPSLEGEVSGVVIDSRKVEPGMVFIATRGERVDGHDYISTAASAGAACVICEQPPKEEVIPYILVKDSFQALKDVAEYYRKQLTIPVVGVTGSMGKTSTKEFIAGVLSVRYHVLKTEGNFNNEIGLPLMVLRIREEHEIAVLEMGISNFGEMHRLARIARPDVCVITNIGICHLENLGDRLGVLRAKSEIFDYLKEDGGIILNGDDEYLRSLEQVKGRKPVWFGFSEKFPVYAKEVESRGLYGSRSVLSLNGETFETEIPLPGHHMVYNALAAACVGDAFGLTKAQIGEGISQVKPVGGRSNIIKGELYTVIDDCYNANPISMKGAVDLLCMAQGRKVAVLGDMFELGENEKEEHYEVGRYAAGKGIDVLVCIGRLGEWIYRGAQEGNREDTDEESRVVMFRRAVHELMEKKPELKMASGQGEKGSVIWYFPDKEAFLKEKEEILTKGDAVLLKASHGMKFEVIKEAIC